MARTQISHIVAEVNGDTVPNASVLVLHRATGEPADVTVNENGTGGNINPATTDSAGRIPGWVQEGSYTLVVSAQNFATYSRAYEALFGASVGNVGPDAVTTAKIPDGVLTTAHVADGAVITVKIGNGQVTEPKLATDSIATRAFASKSVGSSEIAVNAVDAVKLQPDSVGQAQIGTAAVTSAELANDAMTSAKLGPSSAVTADIADGTVTAPKLAANAITSAKLPDDAVTLAAIHDDYLPIGSIMQMPKPFSDSHWLLLDGSTVSRVTYSALFAKFGTTYGVGDGSTTFTLPDLRGRMIFGIGSHGWINAMGLSEGLTDVSRRSPFHYHSTASVGMTNGNHNHQYFSPTQGGYAYPEASNGSYYWFPGVCHYGGPGGQGGHSHSSSGYAGWSGQQTNGPGYQVVYFYIRAL